MPRSLTSPSGYPITIIVLEEPTPAAYHKIYAQVPQLTEQHNPDYIVHMGLDVDSGSGVFKIERSAPREGYHDIPDIDRKVFTRAENKKAFGKAASSLVTDLNIDAAHESWEQACAGMSLPKTNNGKKNEKKQEKQNVSVRLSDDVGTYVCGFQYYASMLEMQKKGGKRNVLFFHVPRLETADEVKIGVKVTGELIRALVDAGV